MTQSRKEQREFDEMMREEIEAGNPFSEYSSYASYKASNRKKPTENEQPKKELSETGKKLYEKIHRVIEKNREIPF